MGFVIDPTMNLCMLQVEFYIGILSILNAQNTFLKTHYITVKSALFVGDQCS